tara:strand:+ start:68 stop:208 length:141 start_codon:yes stop_codon:yes gene_type:complete
MSFLNGADMFIAWLFFIGVVLWWVYLGNYFDGLLNKVMNEKFDKEG